MTRLVFVALLAVSSSAFADNSITTSSAGSTDDRKLTVMWAPIMLVAPIGEFTAEYRVADKLGVSLELGLGRRTFTAVMTDLTGKEIGRIDEPGNEVEAGAQVRYYVLGSFTHGMELGGQILEEYVKFKEPFPPGIVGAAAGGLTVGPFVGYKVATRLGFTFEGQLGARYAAVMPPIQGMGTYQSLGMPDRWVPLLHLNVGWTF
jgi:hypothetical protein